MSGRGQRWKCSLVASGGAVFTATPGRACGPAGGGRFGGRRRGRCLTSDRGWHSIAHGPRSVVGGYTPTDGGPASVHGPARRPGGSGRTFRSAREATQAAPGAG